LKRVPLTNQLRAMHKNLEKLNKIINKKSKGFKTQIELFASLHQTGLFSRLELMIVDSIVKGMPLDNLNKTLLLTENSYIKIIDSIINKLT
jgi:hypothetical protein